MPHRRKFGASDSKLPYTPLEDWSDYLDLPETTIDDMTLEELIALADKLKVELDKIETIIEERKGEDTE